MARRKLSPPRRGRRRAPRTRQGSRAFNLSVATIMVVGISLIVVSKGDRPDAADSPGVPIGEHWHAAIGVNICGEFLPNPPTFESDFHTHADGLIHAHPLSSAAAGDNATVGLFFERGGWELDEDTLDAWDGEKHESGKEKCDGETAGIRFAVNGREQGSDPADYIIRDGDRVVVAFLPEDADLPTEPPSAAALANPIDDEVPESIPEAPATGETVPADPTATTTADPTATTAAEAPTSTGAAGQ